MIIYSPTFTGSVQITGSQTVTGDLTVQGNLTAQTFILSSSVSYFTESFASGSTRFGDSMDDTMVVTGSLRLTGSVGVNTTSPTYLTDIRGPYVAAGMLSIRSTDTATIDYGGVLGFGGFHNGSLNQSQWAAIKGAKENSNVNDNASYLSFGTQITAGSITERMRISSTGFVGIGVTPSNWDTTILAMEIGNKGGFYAGFNGAATSVIYMGNNAYYNGGWKYANTSAYRPLLLDCGDGNYHFQNAAAGTAGNTITWTSLMKMTSAGNLLIGTTTEVGGGGKLQISGSNNAVISQIKSPSGMFQLYSYFSTYNGPILQALDGAGSNYAPLRVECTSMNIGSAAAGGTLSAVNTNTSTTTGNIYSEMGVNTNNTTSTHFVGAQSGFGNRINIFGNGNITNTNGSYGTISDIKLKENIVDTTPKLDKLMQVRIVNYNLIADPGLTQIGVIAQEIEQVFPGLVSEHPDKDAEGNLLDTTTKSVKMSVFTPMLIKAIQELKAEIDELKNK